MLPATDGFFIGDEDREFELGRAIFNRPKNDLFIIRESLPLVCNDKMTTIFRIISFELYKKG